MTTVTETTSRTIKEEQGRRIAADAAEATARATADGALGLRIDAAIARIAALEAAAQPPAPKPTLVISRGTYGPGNPLPVPSPGDYWQFADGAVIAQPWTVPCPMTVDRPAFVVPDAGPGSNAKLLWIAADDVTVRSPSLTGGQVHIGMDTRKRVTITDIVSDRRAGEAVAMWGPCEDVTIGFRSVSAPLHGGNYSVMILRGTKDGAPASYAQRIRVLSTLDVDGGTDGRGLELYRVKGLEIAAGARHHGGVNVISLPECDGVYIHGNGTLSTKGMDAAFGLGMRGWAIELAKTSNVRIGCTPGETLHFDGDGPTDGHDAISCNNGCSNVEVALASFVDIANLLDNDTGSATTRFHDYCVRNIGHRENPMFVVNDPHPHATFTNEAVCA